MICLLFDIQCIVKSILNLVIVSYILIGQLEITPVENPVTEGDNFTFICNNTAKNGSPAFQVNGAGSGDLFDKVTNPPSGVVREFTLPNVTKDDNGTQFSCTLGGLSKVSITLIVNCPSPSPPPSTIACGAGELVNKCTLSC